MTSGARQAPPDRNEGTLFRQLQATRDFVHQGRATLVQLNAYAGVATDKPYKTKREFQ